MGLLSEVDHLVVMGMLNTKKLFTWLYFVVKDNNPKSLSIILSSDPCDIALEPEVLGQFSHLSALGVTVNFGPFTHRKKETLFGEAIKLRVAGLIRILRALTITYLEVRLEVFEEPEDDRRESLLPTIGPRLMAKGIVWGIHDGRKDNPLQFKRPENTAIRDLNASLLAQWFLRETPTLNYVFLHQQGHETCWRCVSRDERRNVVVEQLNLANGEEIKAKARLHTISALENHHWSRNNESNRASPPLFNI
ncbi:hypothetical protein OF83DRAFT_917606 [Amylostereum chailletii]|nr:hypothetical protein OF83DRAFT_917606 [Amylostereum chailletii]